MALSLEFGVRRLHLFGSGCQSGLLLDVISSVLQKDMDIKQLPYLTFWEHQNAGDVVSVPGSVVDDVSAEVLWGWLSFPWTLIPHLP